MIRRASFALALTFALMLGAQALALPVSERLYAGAAPGSEAWTYPETEQRTPTGVTIRNVRDPEIVAYLPARKRANGAAVILLPGGALRMLVMGQENKDIIARFNERGVAVIVLKYRTLQTPPAGAQQAPIPAAGAAPAFLRKIEIRNANANPAPNDEKLNEVLRFATADAQEALRRVRSRADAWGIDKNRVGMIGSSAGGGVAVGALLANAPGATPDFIISLYGPSLQDVTVPANAPPLFIATETGHGPVTDGLLALFAMWRDSGKRAELHIYDVPNFAMPVSLWADRAFAWMDEQKLLTPAPRR
jgi:dienelactone hydrolase